MKSIFIKKLSFRAAILMCSLLCLPSLAQSKEKITFLNCKSVLNQYSHHSSTSNEFGVEFDIEIKETKEYITFRSSKSLAGAYIFLSTDPNDFYKSKNVSNYSTENVWHYKYEFSDGVRTFEINRYTGSIRIESRSNVVTAKSEGKCSKSPSKLF
jgi:hypothetical protein